MVIEYSQWKQEYRSMLETFTDRRVFVLFSGGKDSSLALDLISNAGKEFGFYFEAHAGTYPVHRYPCEEIRKIESYWTQRDVDIVWHDLGETDDLIRNQSNPCLLCRDLRKKMLKAILASLVKDWGSLIIVISHSLWDIVSYSLERTLAEITCDLGESDRTEKNRRFMETAQRFYPILKMREGYSVFRPLIKCNNNDIAQAIAQKDIPVLSVPCAFSDFRPKRIFESYYQKTGLCFEYNKVIDFAIKSLSLPDISFYRSLDKEEYLEDFF